MRHDDIQAIHRLVKKELTQHWRDTNSEHGMYDALNRYDQEFVEHALNYVLGEHYNRAKYGFDGRLTTFGQLNQGRLAIISEFLMEHRHTLSLTEAMMGRVHHLRVHVADVNIPRSIIRAGSPL